MLLPFLLHHANRASKDKSFYDIKDRILKKYGSQIGYDVQNIKGIKCRSCGGTGYHAYYSNHYPYREYDRSDCWHCINGWYRLPQWICLERIRFGKHIFHQPLKREHCIRNPWTENEIGWNVTSSPVIDGYIEHKSSKYSDLALLVLYYRYDRPSYQLYKRQFIRELKWKFRRYEIKLKKLFLWQTWLIEKPDDELLPF